MLLRRFLRGPVQLQVALWLLRRGQEAYRRLTPEERSRARALVRKTGGRPGNLTDSERDELRRLVRTAARR